MSLQNRVVTAIAVQVVAVVDAAVNQITELKKNGGFIGSLFFLENN
jgi:hypothetical protein